MQNFALYTLNFELEETYDYLSEMPYLPKRIYRR